MALRRMQVTDFRCLHRADVELDSEFTLISGPNASGKTSLLEAIYFLGRGRSFRTRNLEALIRGGAENTVVFGEVESLGRRIPLGIEGTTDGVRAHAAGERVTSLADLTRILPVQVIDPEIHRLIEEGPSQRRRYLDWGVFHVEPMFVQHWQAYQKALRQRNAALRAGLDSVTAWDGELIRHGEALTESRRRYVLALGPIAATVARALLGLELTVSYRSGWARELSFREALDQSLNRDRELGATQVGPQRAELSIRLDGAPAKDRISRGQQKLLAAVLLIAQIKLLPGEAPVPPTLLLDDPAAELDESRLTTLIGEVRGQPLQLVVTSLRDELAAFGTPGRRYRIEQGKISLAT